MGKDALDWCSSSQFIWNNVPCEHKSFATAAQCTMNSDKRVPCRPTVDKIKRARYKHNMTMPCVLIHTMTVNG